MRFEYALAIVTSAALSIGHGHIVSSFGGVLLMRETAQADLRGARAPEKVVPKAITLIIPPSAFLLDERVFMFLGILRIAAVLRAAGAEVGVLDLSGVKNYLATVEYFVAHSDATLFGITATTPQMPAVAGIVDVLRQKKPGSKIVLGGPHVTLVNAAAKGEAKRNAHFRRAATHMQELGELFDVLVAGDGEEAIFEACHPAAPKLIDADEPSSDLFLTNAKLEELPWPARDLVDAASYRYTIEGFPAISLIAQLGCPFGCRFCGGRKSSMLRRIRTRTTEDIVAEMEHLWRTTGKSGFMFYDDELNVNKELVGLMKAIARKQEELGVEWRLRGFIKAELFNEEQAAAMHAAGFRWILVGFESGSPRILKNIHKQATAEDNTRCLQIAQKHGIKVKALMSVGHPGETEATIEETRQWLLAQKPNDFDVSLITCYPGTPYYDDAEPVDPAHPEGPWVYTVPTRGGGTGDRLYLDAFDPLAKAYYYKGDPEGGYQSYVYTDTLSREDLVRLRGDLEDSVRQKLNIPFNPGAPGITFEHSMGMPGPNILRVAIPTQSSTT